MSTLRSWAVIVRRPDVRLQYNQWYVVARTKASACRQGKLMSGYDEAQVSSKAGIRSCIVLEELE